jgi:predicted small secreted protein
MWRMIMKLKNLFVVLIMGFMVSLTACNTFEGMGKDVESTGEQVQDTAKDVKKGL